MTAKHTQSKLRVERNADGYRRSLATDAALICDNGMTFGIIFGDGDDAADRAARLALCWNMHDEMADALAIALYAMEQSANEASGLNDLGLKQAADKARAILAKLEPTK